jgi:hypothetical protein
LLALRGLLFCFHEALNFAVAMPNRIGKQIIAIIREWWGRRGSLAISLVVTLAALGVYFVTFLGERPMPLFDFVTNSIASTRASSSVEELSRTRAS